MTRTSFSRISVIALLLTLAVCCLAAHRPAAQAAALPNKAAALPPNITVPSPAAAAAAPATLPSLLSGKAYPAALKAGDVDASFQIVDLVDTQGKPGTYATKGETAAVGGETFLVAYFVAPVPGQPASPTIPAGATLHLAFINMRYVQAMLNPHSAVSVLQTPPPPL